MAYGKKIYHRSFLLPVLTGEYPLPFITNVDSLDWKDYGADSIIEKVTCNENLEGGAIILCHNGAKYTADALEEMIVRLKEQGYSFVKMSDLIYKDNYEMNAAGQQCPCGE